MFILLVLKLNLHSHLGLMGNAACVIAGWQEFLPMQKDGNCFPVDEFSINNRRNSADMAINEKNTYFIGAINS